MPAFGVEKWCNMLGRYIFYVNPNAAEINFVNIQTIGVMGTMYVRDSLLTEHHELVTGDLLSFSVDHIYSELDIANDLVINLRHQEGSELAFATIANTSIDATVTIDT